MHDAKYLESLGLAKELAARNGGVLPSVSRLTDEGYHTVVSAIREDRGPFEPILAKMGRGRDKNKYAYVAANMDKSNDELAKETGLSKTTIINWKTEINEAAFIDPDPSEIPEDVFAEDVTRFIIRNMPPGWKLDVSHDANGCYVTLVQPNGMRRGLDSAYGSSVVHSIVSHVNFARRKSGMEPAGWEG